MLSAFAGSNPYCQLFVLLADLTPKQQAANVESFEKVWSTVRDRHPDVKLAGLDWQAQAEAINKAADAYCRTRLTPQIQSRLRRSSAIHRRG